MNSMLQAHRLSLKALCALGVLAVVSVGSTGASAQDAAAEGSVSATPEDASAPAVDTTSLGRPIAAPAGSDANLSAALGGFEAALSVYAAEITDYRETIARVVELEYRQRRREISDLYDTEIEASRVEERARREDAVAEFEQFLERFPDDLDYTPDVMFRLAELYYERAIDAYNEADRDYERLLGRYERGIDAEPPELPRKDFGPTIATFNELIRRFPSYRQVDGAFYLLAVCYEEMDQWEESLEAFTALVTEYPDSDFAQESWLRIGEVQFDSAEFELARTAYERALGYGPSRWYDKILFKLGWSTYLLGEYDQAIGRFGQLLGYYESEGDESVQALREEAVQYFAVSLAEEDWDIDGQRDADFLLPRLARYLPADQDLPFRLEVLDRLAAMLMEIERYDFAVDLYNQLIAEYPLDRENPWRHEKIVLAWGYLRDVERAFEEQRRIGQLYAAGTPWYNEQERLGNTDALEFADRLAREGLLRSANYYYVQANELATQASVTGDAVVEAQAIEGFRLASRLYEQFLEQYPNVDEAYETRMFYAQALRNATDFEAAGEQFELVRDSDLSDQYRITAASLAITSYENALNRDIDAGRLEVRAWPAYNGPMRVEEVPVEEEPESDEPQGPEDPEIREVPSPEPIPELSQRWVAAVDRYSALGLQAEDDPNRGVRNLFAVGKLYYDHFDYEPARERFVAVLDACREINETAYAAAFLIESFAATNDTEGLRFWSGELDRRSMCVPADIREALAADLDRLAMGEMAQRAEQLVNEGRFEEAALEYSRLATEYADNPATAPLGLYNAGLIYEQNLQRYELAMQQFERLVNEFPESEWVDDSLVRIAINSKKFFDFDHAVATFLTLHEIGFSDPALVEYPLLDAAQLMEYSGRNEEAARAYLDFVDAHPSDERAAVVLYTAGTLFEEAGLARDMLSTYERFRSQYGRAPSSVQIDIDAAYIDTLYRTAKHYDEQGDTRSAARYYDMVVSEYDVRQPEAPAARYAAGQVVYGRAMEVFEQWDSIELGSSLSAQRAGITRRTEGIIPVLEAFDQVINYGSADWTVCALYMRGQSYQTFANVLIGLPMPDFGDDYAAEDEYMIMLTDATTPVEDAAIREWEIAYPVMQELGVVNQCTMDTTRELNRVRGDQYPLQKEAIVHEQRLLFTPQVFVGAPADEAAATDVPDVDAVDPFGGQ